MDPVNASLTGFYGLSTGDVTCFDPQITRFLGVARYHIGSSNGTWVRVLVETFEDREDELRPLAT